MARIRDFVVTEFVNTASTWRPSRMPVHESGDLLIALWGKDSTTGLAPAGTTGGGSGTWTEYEDVNSTAANGGIHVCRATAADAAYVGTLTNESGVLIVISVADVYGTTLADCITLSEVATVDDTAAPFAGASGFSTTYDGQLIIDAFFSDGGTSPTAYAPSTNLYAGDAANGSLCAAYRYIDTAGSIPQVNFFGRGNDDGRFMMLAIRPAASTNKRSAHSDPAISVGQVLRPMVGLSTMESDNWAAPTILAVGSLWEAVYTHNSGVYADATTNINNISTADVYPGGNVNDAIYFGHSSPFQSIAFQLSQAASAGAGIAEYWNGSAWATLTLINGTTATLTSTLNRDIQWVPPTNWATTAVNGTTKYWIRLRVTTGYTGAIYGSYSRRDGNTIANVAATASADNGTNPYTDGAAHAGASSSIALSGTQCTFGAALDMDTGIIYGSVRGALARDLAIDIAGYNQSGKLGGIGFSLYDTNNNQCTYTIGVRGAKDLKVDDRNVFAVDWNGAATAAATEGSINKSAVTRSVWWTHGRYGAAAVVWSMLSIVSKLAIAGGTEASPLTLSEYVKAANTSVGIFPFLQQSGSAVEVWVPLQVGGGSTIGIDASGAVFQYPTRYDGVDYYRWNAADNVAGMTFYPKSSDYFNFKGAQWISANKAAWTWHASSASSGWTGDFSNTVLKGQTVTLRAAFDVVNSDNMTFEDCTIDQNGASLDNQTYIDSKITCDSLADMALITNGTFSSSGTGYGIEVGGSASTITLTGNSFTGYAASNGSTGNEAIYVNIATGTVTINLSGGTTPSIRTAGATVNVVVSTTVTFTGLPTGCDIVILTAGTSTILQQVDAHGSTSYAWVYSGAPTVDVGFIKPGYVPFYLRGLALTTSNASIPVSLTPDRNYA